MPRPRIRVGVTSTKLTSQGSAITVTGSAAQAAFVPTDIAGLVAWYDFSDITTLFQDTAFTSAVTTTGQSIQGARNKANPGTSDVTEGTIPPTYTTNVQNGLSVARSPINSPSSKLGCSNLDLSGTNAVTAFAVWFNSFDSNAVIWEQGTDSSNVVLWVALQAATDALACTNWGDAGNHVVQGTTGVVPHNTWYIIAMKSDRSTSNDTNVAWVNGVTAGMGAGTKNSTNNYGNLPFTLETYLDGTTNRHMGDYGEFLIYDSALGSTDINSVGSYLATKWDLTWTAI